MQTRSDQPLNPWTIPNAIGFLRLAGIPVFLVLALSSSDGQDLAAVILYAVIGWADYLDGFAARLARQVGKVTYTAVRREHNELADRLVNEALDSA